MISSTRKLFTDGLTYAVTRPMLPRRLAACARVQWSPLQLRGPQLPELQHEATKRAVPAAAALFAHGKVPFARWSSSSSSASSATPADAAPGTNIPATGVFRPPALVEDMTPATKAKWSSTINAMFVYSNNAHNGRNPRRRTQWFNPLEQPVTGPWVSKSIEWNAFPRQVVLRNASKKAAWAEADSSRDVQDEYCEWAVTRDPATNKILRIDFTAEGPEYFQLLASEQPDTLVNLYRTYVSKDVQLADLLKGGEYDPANKWNSSTKDGRVMHLKQINNTLGAEVELGASATVIRHINGVDITSEQQLASCSRNGNAKRNSDPHISAEVNALARQGFKICLADPVGLYIKNFQPQGFVTPDGTNASKFFVVQRGSGINILRARFEVPKELGYTVSDITIKGTPITFGGQVTEFINIHLIGIATDQNPSNRDAADTCGYL